MKNKPILMNSRFWVTVLAGISLVEPSGYALNSFPVLQPILPVKSDSPNTAQPAIVIGPVNAPVSVSTEIPLSDRPAMPQEISWFFMVYKDVSVDASIRLKNRHCYIISDVAQRKEYVVQLGQSSRRVEIYSRNSSDALQSSHEVHVYRPGCKRVVVMQKGLIASDTTTEDKNTWLWRTPLWNSLQLRIYAMGDLWRDSTFKKYSCAGFVHRFLGEVGVDVPPMNAWDMAKLPYEQVTLDELEPGDIITIRAASQRQRRRWGHNVTHVGVYIGNGQIIHAATSSPRAKRAYIRIADLSTFEYRIDKILRPPELL